jgi:fructose-1,6-bisphosphatase I
MSSAPPANDRERIAPRENLTTLQSHILAEENKYPEARGTFSWILSAMALSAKVIADKIRRARIHDVLGAAGTDNVQGERQQKLDVIANETLLRCLGSRSGVAIVASEEDDNPTLIQRQTGGERPYCVLFDPLDGSSNLDSCGAVGTIFSILRHDRRASSPEGSLLQPGVQQAAAGYILYGSSTVFVLTTGSGTHMFVLDPSIGSFLLVQANVRIPEGGKYYSVNEGNRRSFPEGYQRYLDWAQQNGYSTRYSGTMVADVHRALVSGGLFFYPPTKKAPEGKLRLLYEVNPMAMIIEQAGGKAFTGRQRVLEVQPRALHERIACCMGSPDEVDHLLRHLE